jgi:hypothetical protein
MRSLLLFFGALLILGCAGQVEQTETDVNVIEGDVPATSDMNVSEKEDVYIPDIVNYTVVEQNDTVVNGTETNATRPDEKLDKMSLWTNGTQLRGADIWQRKVYPELDGPTFMGNGKLGPPYTQQDFDDLAALGANFVVISHPGIYTETAPYTVDNDVQDNLDEILEKIEEADMFAVIAFRTGPGRSEFTFVREDVGDWFDKSYLDDSVWTSEEKQDPWADMWRHTAMRYKDNPIVVGYELMVEPNPDEVFFDIYDPEEFYPKHEGSTYDWNRFYPEMVDAIRDADNETPILVGGMGYSGVAWLSYLDVSDDDRIVYTVHQYEPSTYTHQAGSRWSYPGSMDTDWDDVSDSKVDKAWLDELLQEVDDFRLWNDASVACTEYGAYRWLPGADGFVEDEIELFEERAMNHAIWSWDPAYDGFTGEVNAFNFRFGSDQSNTEDVSNELQDTIKDYWSRNRVRPSDFG